MYEHFSQATRKMQEKKTDFFRIKRDILLDVTLIDLSYFPA